MFVARLDFESRAAPAAHIEVTVTEIPELGPERSQFEVVREPFVSVRIPAFAQVLEVRVCARPDGVHVVVPLLLRVRTEPALAVVAGEFRGGLLQRDTSRENTETLIDPLQRAAATVTSSICR